MMKYLNVFKPNGKTDNRHYITLIVSQITIAIIIWIHSDSKFLPTPIEIGNSLFNLIKNDNFFLNLFTTIGLNMKAMFVGLIVSMIISYCYVIPFFRPVISLLTKFRFLTLVGLSFFFTLLSSSGQELKLYLMVFGVSGFLTTAFVSNISTISSQEYNHARTLFTSEWRVILEVVVLARLAEFLEIFRQNFAISWVMITLVEGLVRSDGGIGVMLLNQNRFLHLDAVFAIQFVITICGILQDYLFFVLRTFLFPYSTLTISK